jgi:periplasmic protein TonB
MSVEPQQVPGDGLRTWQGCLVGGDPEQRERQQRVRRRALVISITTQSVIVAVIVLFPLFAKPARIALANVMPLPPYYAHPPRAPQGQSALQAPRPQQNICRFCPPHAIPPTLVTHTESPNDANDGQIQGLLDDPSGPGTPGFIPLVDTRVRLQPPDTRVEAPHTVHLTHLDAAMLTHRTEPIYPTLMRQIGRSGQVQLHAIIGTDGTVQSLQVVGGDAGFYQSALEAVRQWRYKPTSLNGKPVEVDTFITVIYNIAR